MLWSPCLPCPGERSAASPDQSTGPCASHRASLLLRFGIRANEQEEIIQEIGKDPLPKVKQEEEQLNLFRRAGPNRGCQLGNRCFADCSPGLPLERSGMPWCIGSKSWVQVGFPSLRFVQGAEGAGGSGAAWSPIPWLQKPLGAAKTGSLLVLLGEVGASAAKPAPE